MRRILLFLVLALPLISSGQSDPEARKNTFFPIPVAFWTPETRIGVGAALIYNFYLNKSDTISPPSQLQGGFAITQERQQLYYLPYKLWWGERQNYAFGEVGYYKYNYFFYGVGNDDANAEERYGVDFTRIRVNYLRQVLKTNRGGWSLGARAWIEDWTFTEFEDEGALASGRINGAEGGLTLDPGFIIFGDYRDNVYNPSRGSYLELVTQHSTGDFRFHRYRVDARIYNKVAKPVLWANQIFVDVTTGDTPFYMMTMLGGTKRMRGYYEGRFRDKSGVLYQTELRAKIWRRWGAVAFFSAGIVDRSPNYWSIANLRNTSGAGIRFLLDPEKNINVRFDVAAGPGSTQFYFTVGEAF